jgi:hypothetical protein
MIGENQPYFVKNPSGKPYGERKDINKSIL